MKKIFCLPLLVSTGIWISSSLLQAQSSTTYTVPIVSVAATTPNASETGPTPGVFTFTCAPGTNILATTFQEPLRIFYHIGGTAQNGIDYVAITSNVVVPAGSATATVTITPIDDTLVEGPETVTLELIATPLNVGPPYVVGAPRSATVTIADNDVRTNIPPTVSLTSPANGATFAAPANITLIADPRDTDGYVQTVEFFEGKNSLGIVTNNPYSMSPVNPWQIVWPNVPAGNYTLAAVATDNAGATATSRLVQISVVATNPPLPEVNIFATDPYATEIPPVPPGMGMPQRYDPAVFTVRRSSGTNYALTVYYSMSGTAQNGVDYTFLPGSVTVPVGAYSADIIVSPIDDNLVEGTETVIATLAPIACPDIIPAPPGCYRIGLSNRAIAYILDNDTNTPPTEPPVVTVVATDPDASETGPDAGTFAISRTGATDLPLTVYYYTGGTAQNGIDYIRLPNYVQIAAGAASADVVVTPIDDTLFEGPETVLLQLRPALLPYGDTAGATTLNPSISNVIIWPAPYVIGSPSNAVVTIADNDKPATNTPPTVKISRPAAGSTFIAPANIGLVAEAVDRDGSVASVEFFAGTTSLGFASNMLASSTTPNLWYLTWPNVPAGKYTLTAKATDDGGASTISPPVQVAVVASNPPPETNTVPVVNITATDSVASEGPFGYPTTLLVQSNVICGAAANISSSSNWVSLDGANPSRIYWTNVFCGTNTATFEVRRSGPTNADLTVYYQIGGTASNGVDYVALPGSVTILAGRKAAQIVIVPIDDTLVEGTETVILSLVLPPTAEPAATPPYVIGPSPRAAAIILDNDAPLPPTVRLPDGLVNVWLPATNATGYRLEVSSDLITWMPCLTNVAAGDGVSYVDPDAPANVLRFYRIVPEPILVPEP